MPGIVPNEGELQLLADLLGAGENWLLCLATTSVTPSETDTAATWTAAEATFSGYSRKTLTRTVSGSTWATPSIQAPTDAWSAEAGVAQSTYNAASPQTWTAGAGVSATVYGFFYLGATSGKLLFCQLLGVSQPITAGTVVTIVPPFGAA
jgi:hypothetical protein